MGFNHYLEDEDDKPYFSVNSLAYYYDKMAEKEKLVKELAKLVMEYDQVLSKSISENKETLVNLIVTNEKTLKQLTGLWDEKMQTFDDGVKDLLAEWVDDGTIDHVIDTAIVDNKIAPLSQQLVEEVNQRKVIDDKAFYNGVTLNRNHKPLVTILDDDGYPQVYDLLRPIAQSENVPITTAIITGRVGKSSLSMSLNQIKSCKDAGMEVVSHTHTHQRLSSLAPNEQEQEIRLAKEFLQLHGFNHDVLVYPFGAADDTTQKITARYHTAGVYIDYGQSRLNNPPILQYRLERVYYNDEAGNNYVQRCKDKIDEAIQNNSWLIIGMHCFYDNFDPNGLVEVIQYAKTRGIEIASFKRALEYYGNVIDLPDFKVGANGKIESDSIGRYITPKGSDGVNGNTLLTSFKIGTSVTLHSSSATYEGMPVSSGSVMFTHRMQSDWLSHQEVFVVSNKNRYERTWNITTGAWNAWEKVYPETVSVQQFYHQIGGSASINGTLPISYFAEGTTVSTHHSTGSYSGMPASSASVMYTHKPKGGDHFAYQEVFVTSNKSKYLRTWNTTTSSWNEWGLVTT